MTRSYCKCGRTYIDHGDNLVVSAVTCGACWDSVRHWLLSQPWYVRLDEWQHCHAPKWPKGQRFTAMAWYWIWRPLCAATERHHTGMWRPK